MMAEFFILENKQGDVMQQQIEQEQSVKIKSMMFEIEKILLNERIGCIF